MPNKTKRFDSKLGKKLKLSKTLLMHFIYIIELSYKYLTMIQMVEI